MASSQVNKLMLFPCVLCLCLSPLLCMETVIFNKTENSFSHLRDDSNRNDFLERFDHKNLALNSNKNINKSTANLLVVHVSDNSGVDHIKNITGIQFIKQIFNDEPLYLFRLWANVNFTDVINRILIKEPTVLSVYPQEVFERHRRHTLGTEKTNQNTTRKLTRHFSRNLLYFTQRKHKLFNDPLYNDQWYLDSNYRFEGTLRNGDIDVLPVWKAGFTGKGIRVSVLDDGVARDNAEVSRNFDQTITHDFSELQDDGKVPLNSHGTYCAAIVAGVANNNYCGIGVAYNAKVGGARVLNGRMTDVREAMGVIHALDLVHIYTASWGPKDDGKHVGGPGPLTRLALKKGVQKGRDGKGSIYVWAAGNGGKFRDNCNLDGYASSPYTMTIGALTEEGRSTYYSEACASVIASTYVGGLHHPPNKRNLAVYKNMIKVVHRT